jgi:hypothetical protein|tara:strand:+ start:14807 stop:15574 length:768 start_codon:yes stop_codon:yes gene_type:complete
MKYKGTEINKILSLFFVIFIVYLFISFKVTVLFFAVISGLIIVFDWKSKHCILSANKEYAKMTDQLDAPDQTVGSQADIISNSNGDIDNYLNLEKKSIYWKTGIDALWFVYWIILTTSSAQAAMRVEQSNKNTATVMVVVFAVTTIIILLLSISTLSKEMSLFKKRKHKLLALANFMTTMKNHPMFDPNLSVNHPETSEPNKDMFSNFTEDQSKKMKARHEFSLIYASEKGWKEDLSVEQIIEIRNQESWKNPTI